MYSYEEFYKEMCNIINKPFIYEVELKYADPDPSECLKRHFSNVKELISYTERARIILKKFRFDYYYHAPSMKLKVVMFLP